MPAFAPRFGASCFPVLVAALVFGGLASSGMAADKPTPVRTPASAPAVAASAAQASGTKAKAAAAKRPLVGGDGTQTEDDIYVGTRVKKK